MLGIPLLGAIPEDQQVIISTNRGEPLVLQKKLSLSGIAFENAARRLIGKQDYFIDLNTPYKVCNCSGPELQGLGWCFGRWFRSAAVCRMHHIFLQMPLAASSPAFSSVSVVASTLSPFFPHAVPAVQGVFQKLGEMFTST